jgi:two-component system NtrC family sensor kinase
VEQNTILPVALASCPTTFRFRDDGAPVRGNRKPHVPTAPLVSFLTTTTSGSGGVASLFVIKGRDQGHRFELEGVSVGIGRDASNSIQLHDTEVSRRHAEVCRNDDKFQLTDLGSSNGTFVNGRKLTASHTLASGDRLQIGASEMLYTGPSETGAADLAKQIKIISRGKGGDDSQIVQSMGQDESSDLLSGISHPGQSPWLARARSNLQIMYRTALAVSHTLDIDQLLQRIMELIFEWVEADRGCIMLVHSETGKLEPKVRRDRKGVATEDKITISKTILDYVREKNEGVLTSNAGDDDRWDTGASIVKMGIREAICVPMQGRYDAVGVIYIDTTTSARRLVQQGIANKFTSEHLKLMVAVAHQAALAVEDTSYYSAMVQAERLAAVGQTIATLSHHIKNILQGIRGGSYMIEMGLEDHGKLIADSGESSSEQLAKAGETIRRGWDIVEKNQEKISKLVLDMLTFSKEREPDLQPGDVNQVASDVIELMVSRADDFDVELGWEPGQGIPTLTFDAEGLHRAILNVVTNAIDACDKEEGSFVRVATDFDAKRRLALITVEDNGGGIPPDEIDKIFLLFESRKGQRGTGLGLPVSQKILKEHGGQIIVESEVGRGSLFTLELPAVFPVDDHVGEDTMDGTQDV